ncbi:PREDICTED: transcription factor bHLH47-like isoform X2 [Ipomoea nil]|uniref:transcription factor bHLH47-like isoform X2 n=1 Tax=Ipomoea nil TaxID=35883 RepID=UPI000901D1FB|nr:PREDICTED: transcription factor bHLH47-like isoform X2 [Ipomoea nil]
MASEASTPVNDCAVHVFSSSRKRKHDKAPRNHEAEREPSNKVPRKIHKAEREKQKRDNMNVLFAELANVLDPSHQNYGKACILKETMRLVRELIVQVDNLRKENVALNSESHYMIVEKDELKEEKIALEVQIENLLTKINETIRSQTTNITSPPQLTEDHLRTSIHDYASSSAAATGPVLVVPLHNDLQMYSTADNPEALQNLPPSVSRPRPRYPSPSDSWPSRVLNVASSTTEDS